MSQTPSGSIEKRPATSPLEDSTTSKKQFTIDEHSSAALLTSIDMNNIGEQLEPLANILFEKVKHHFSTLFEEMTVKLTAELKKEVQVLKGENHVLKNQIQKRDTEIKVCKQHIDQLEMKVDHLEMYSRRSSIRINGVPENNEENTDNIVVKISECIGVDIFQDHIDRSHRVGRKGDYNRPIIVKFHGHRQKVSLLKAKRKLKEIDTVKLFGATRIFLNEDLTKERAAVAAEARKMKKEGRIADTWTRDGIIFIKTRDGSLRRITTKNGLSDI